MHKWDNYIPYVQLAYNSKTSALTGSTPFSLVYGRALNKFEKYGRTKTKGDLSLVLWKKKQTEISEVIYPAVKGRVMQEKKKDDR